MQQILKDTISSVADDFKENELAYLALTSKIELPLRDRWAFNLSQQLSGNAIVSREWQRTDIAILKKDAPIALIELKAMYTFDAALDLDEISGFIEKMEKDEVKATKLTSQHPQIYTVLLATHPKAFVPIELDGIVKYRAGINRAINTFETEKNVLKVAKEAVYKKFKNKNTIASGVISGGNAFGIDTDVLYWINKA
jgi:hypothetical protein